MENKKSKKIVFNEEIDSAISGYTLAITFVGIGIFLLNNLDYFGNKTVSVVILSIFSIIGIVGTFIELGKNKEIKGFEDIGVGLVFFIPWLLIYLLGHNVLWNIVGFILLIIGVYGIVGGCIKIVVSFIMNEKSTNNKLKKLITAFFKLLPTVASFILVICNILKIIYEMKK